MESWKWNIRIRRDTRVHDVIVSKISLYTTITRPHTHYLKHEFLSLYCCPIHFALQVLFSWLSFGVLFHFVRHFCSLSVRYLICSMALVPKVVLVSVLYFLLARFVSLVATILSFFVCKPRVSTCFHPRARKEVLVNVRSADILTLIEGSLQIARNVVIIWEEQTSRPPRNQSGTVHAPFFSWVRLTFLVRRAQRTIIVLS